MEKKIEKLGYIYKPKYDDEVRKFIVNKEMLTLKKFDEHLGDDIIEYYKVNIDDKIKNIVVRFVLDKLKQLKNGEYKQVFKNTKFNHDDFFYERLMITEKSISINDALKFNADMDIILSEALDYDKLNSETINWLLKNDENWKKYLAKYV